MDIAAIIQLSKTFFRDDILKASRNIEKRTKKNFRMSCRKIIIQYYLIVLCINFHISFSQTFLASNILVYMRNKMKIRIIYSNFKFGFNLYIDLLICGIRSVAFLIISTSFFLYFRKEQRKS